MDIYFVWSWRWGRCGKREPTRWTIADFVNRTAVAYSWSEQFKISFSFIQLSTYLLILTPFTCLERKSELFCWYCMSNSVFVFLALLNAYCHTPCPNFFLLHCFDIEVFKPFIFFLSTDHVCIFVVRWCPQRWGVCQRKCNCHQSTSIHASGSGWSTGSMLITPPF